MHRPRWFTAALATLAAIPLLVVPASAASTATVFYKPPSAWSTVNLHYAPTGGAWTTVPGVSMSAASCAGWYTKVVDLGAATGMQATFNNGSGTWDNNGGADYRLNAGTSTVKDGVVTGDASDPCSAVPADTTAPTAPSGLTANADQVTVTLGWTASTDDRGVTGYQITRTGGSGGAVVLTSGYANYIDGSLAAGTAYAYAVRAVDAAGNLSAASATVSVTTGTAPPPAAGGAMLGGDPRKESIYFVLTARFYDGDTSNDRGGSQDIASGNAANHDPMFRGDFKGLIDKLDYIKGLGFSAVWITPVVLNRSDYDYHGYHGWDFYRVDTRLESPGSTYQDLIDKAHAEGLKIFQDVVYNHSARWGANGLFVPKVWGAKDGQWDGLYSTKVDGQQYDPMTEFHGTDPAMTTQQNQMAQGRPYNGDLWTTTEPAGNTCRNWGTATGQKSPEGFTLHNCQWPAPTSGMFPASLYHQCWIGNWEGEDARSCWLADDLADFDTENPVVQNYLINAYNKYIDMGVDGFRVDTAVHIPRVTWNRRFLPAMQQHLVQKYGAAKAQDFYVFGEVAAFVNDKWNRGSVNHSAQFFTWKERRVAGSVTASDYGVVSSATGAVATTLAQPLVKHVQRLNLIRRAVPALQMGQYSTDGVSGDIAYKRRYTSGSVDSFALVTVSSSATFTGIPNGTYTDAVSGDVRTVTNGSLTATLTTKGDMRVYVLALPGNPAPGKVGADGPYLR